MFNYTFDDGGVYIGNLSNKAEQYGISQYRFPHNYELAGRNFSVSDGNGSHSLHFICRNYVLLDGKRFEYESLKISGAVYFVRIGYSAAVVDLEQNLITLIKGEDHFNGKIDDLHAGSAVHTDAPDDLTGTAIAWVLGCSRYMSHEFIECGSVRVRWSPVDDAHNDFQCKITKIKELLYLVDVPGRVPYHVDAPVLTTRVISVQDYDHMLTVGCIIAGGITPVMFSGYARYLGEANVVNIPGGNKLNLDTGEFM
jgi:hypothetical protein